MLFLLSSFYFASGFLATYFLTNGWGFHSVMSSGLVGLIGAILFYTNTPQPKKQLAKAMIFCGSFAGMSQPELICDWHHFVFVSLIGGGLNWFFQDRFYGHGGKLGAKAFLGVAFTGVILWLF